MGYNCAQTAWAYLASRWHQVHMSRSGTCPRLQNLFALVVSFSELPKESTLR